jgi:hypothetical protein
MSGKVAILPPEVESKTTGYCWPTPSTEIGVLNMPSLKAKKLSKLPREKVLLEL